MNGREANQDLGHQMDDRKQLNRIPEIFRGLVKDRSPIVAARTGVVLLMGE